MDMRCCASLAAVGMLAIGGAAASGPDRAAERRDDQVARRVEEELRLKRIRRDIEDLRQRLAATESRAGSVLDAIEEISLRIALLGREAEALKAQEAATRDREAAARREAAAIEARLSVSERNLRDWMREVYKAGPVRYLRVVAAASSPGELVATQRAVEALSRLEGGRIEEYRSDRLRLDRVIEEIAQQSADLIALQAKLVAKEQDLRAGRRQKTAILSGLKRQEASQKLALMELEQTEKDLRALLDRLRRSDGDLPMPSLGFAKARGRLPWPLDGPIAVPFGNVRHPRFSTVVPHSGLDIGAPGGTEVRAVFDARVAFSDWFRGYGQMIVLDHGDRYLSIYGNLGERLVDRGDMVSGGEPIARSGEGGSFDTPGVYFEIRDDGRPEHPRPWVRAGRGDGPKSRGDRRRGMGDRRTAP